MKATILGTGPTLQHYKPSKNEVTFGVNDIFKYQPVHNLLIIDQIWTFSKWPDRLETIKNSTPLQFYSQIDDWALYFKNFHKIKLKPMRGVLDLVGPELCYSHDSTFVACVLAYHQGFKEITLYGVDFTNHPRLSRHSINILRNYESLAKEIHRFGVNLQIGHPDSLLNKVLPCCHTIYS